MTRVLLVEDDARIREILERGLGARGFSIFCATSAETGLELARKLAVDLILLDLVLPAKDGFWLLEQIRAEKPHLPVIAVTALDQPRSKVEGLEAGADDYVTKPFSLDELAARIRARLRWNEENRDVFQLGGLTVDVVAHRVLVGDQEVPLSARELSLLAAFVRHPGQLLSRAQLLQLVWDLDFDPGSNVVDVYVAALRRKVGGEFIETVRGIGYRFVVPDETPAGAAAP
ncbi:MAG: response regulator transcription factor [Candidatus Dormibacteria bacterium]